MQNIGTVFAVLNIPLTLIAIRAWYVLGYRKAILDRWKEFLDAAKPGDPQCEFWLLCCDKTHEHFKSTGFWRPLFRFWEPVGGKA